MTAKEMETTLAQLYCRKKLSSRKRVKNNRFSSEWYYELTCVPQKTWCSPNHGNLGIQSFLEIVSLQMP